jgi:hypothetical protein
MGRPHLKKKKKGYNPSFSGDTDQEEEGSRLIWTEACESPSQ